MICQKGKSRGTNEGKKAKEYISPAKRGSAEKGLQEEKSTREDKFRKDAI